jgi:hypothetical protein
MQSTASYIITILLTLLFSSPSLSHWKGNERDRLLDDKYTYHIQKTKTPIKLDGELSEDIWKNVQEAKNFYLNRPYDSSFAGRFVMSLEAFIRFRL